MAEMIESEMMTERTVTVETVVTEMMKTVLIERTVFARQWVVVSSMPRYLIDLLSHQKADCFRH